MTDTKKRYLINSIAVLGVFVILKSMINFEILNRYYEGIIILMGINIILATSLNLTTGFLGQLTLGHAGFMAIGAYTAGIFSQSSIFSSMELGRMGSTIDKLIVLILSLLLGGILAGIFGFIVGVPALRLRGDYLGIITLGFGEVIRVLLINLEFTGGSLGIRRIPNIADFNNVFWIMAIVVVFIMSIINSRHGRSILSIRENEIAAEACGVPTARYKIATFMLSAFFAGVAGALFAFHQRSIEPNKFGFMYSIEILIIVVLGGMGSITGSVIAAIVLTILPELLREFSDYRLLIYAILLLAVMLFKPSGLLGTKEFSLFRSKSNKQEKIGGEK